MTEQLWKTVEPEEGAEAVFAAVHLVRWQSDWPTPTVLFDRVDMSEVEVISRAEYKRLKERDEMLSALNAAGVDNWSGYSHAFEILDQWKKEDV